MIYEHSITFQLNAPKKPYWEVLGFKSYQDYVDSIHWIFKGEDGKYHCDKCKENTCPCLTNK